VSVLIDEAELVRRISAALRKKGSPVAKLNDIQELLDLRGPNARVRQLMDMYAAKVKSLNEVLWRVARVQLALQEDPPFPGPAADMGVGVNRL
jgi:hypothetical protein